jgi:hypothetical protein
MFSTTCSLFFWYLSAPILYSQHLPASFLQNRGVGVYPCSQNLFVPAIHAIYNVLSKIRTLCTFLQRRPFVFISL